MIYIIYAPTPEYEPAEIDSLWQVDCDDAHERYKQFMLDKAKEINLVVNPHYLNVMNYKDHNKHLTLSEYQNACVVWRDIIKTKSFKYYLKDVLGAEKIKYKEIY